MGQKLDPLRDKWWEYVDEHDEFRDVILLIFRDHQLELLERVFSRNQTGGRGPQSYEELGGILQRNANHLRKGRGYPTINVPAWAGVLDVEVAELFPDRISWLSKATRRLQQDIRLSVEEATIYVRYLLANPDNRDGELDGRAVECVALQAPSTTAVEIGTTVQGVADALAQAMPRMFRRRPTT